jgi:type II secretory pathway pseudopilin PulG
MQERESRMSVRVRGERGFTVVEMVIIGAVITIVAGFSVFSIVRSRENMRLLASTRELQTNLERASADAARRHDSARVQVIDAHRYLVAMDFSGDGTLDANGDSMIDLADEHILTLPPGVAFETSPLPAPAVFDWRGRVPEDIRFIVRGVDSAGQPNHFMPDVTVDITAGGDIIVNRDAHSTPSPQFSVTPFPTPAPTVTVTPTPTPTATPG